MGYSNVDESRLAELRSLLDKNKITSKKKKGFQSFISDYAPIKEENRIESNTIESEQRPNSDLHRTNREKYGESAEYYAQLKNSADFNEKAKQGLAIKKPEYNDTSKKGFFDTLFSDYDPITYSNGNSGMLTEEEQNIYGYLVSTQGEKKAKQIMKGASEEEIRAGWQNELEAYKKMREKYLLYE